MLTNSVGEVKIRAPAGSVLANAIIVLGLEVSRLARNSMDWQRLLEICALTDTLILDEDGVYDPAHFNDRLLLGLKGTMSEAELHVLRARLQGGILNKARRGECNDGRKNVCTKYNRMLKVRNYMPYRKTVMVHENTPSLGGRNTPSTPPSAPPSTDHPSTDLPNLNGICVN